MQPHSILATLVFAAIPASANGNHKHLHARSQVTNNKSVPDAINQITFAGCYSSKGNMTVVPPTPALSVGGCEPACKAKGYPAFGMDATTCYCGFAYPPTSDKVSDSKCDGECPYWNQDSCGGFGVYSIYNRGVIKPASLAKGDGSSDVAGSSTSSSKPAGASTTSSTAGVPTAASSSASSSDSNGSGPNTVGIAVGVVVGVIGLAAIIGGAFFFLRRRRNAQLEEEHRRNAAVNAFISGSKPPSTSGGLSMTDARLDPVAVHRRLSDGSIADNEDYSRRILRVTNA